jgi:hypothetical protein
MTNVTAPEIPIANARAASSSGGCSLATPSPPHCGLGCAAGAGSEPMWATTSSSA